VAAVSPARAQADAGKQTLRVDFEKLDDLLNLVGELVIGKNALGKSLLGLGSLSRELQTHRRIVRRAGLAMDVGAAERKAMLKALVDELSRAERAFEEVSREIERTGGRLDRISGNLRDQVMKLRMVPIARVFTKYHRTVRDIARQLGKKVRLEIRGGETELDKILVEALDGPLMHLVRNSMDHGIEPEAARAAAGKPAEGTLVLSALQRGNQIVVEVSDDGAGILPDRIRDKAREEGLVPPDELSRLDDRQVLELIFKAGFSTATQVTDLSGRGVGMDVVRQAISELKGTVDVSSTPGKGTTFSMKLPLTLAIIQVLLVRAGGEPLALPLDLVSRTLQVDRSAVRRLYDRDVIEVAGKQVPLLSIAQTLHFESASTEGAATVSVILVDIFGETYGLVADRLDAKREIVIKSLGDLLENVPGCAGATLDGDRPVLILDVPTVVTLALEARGAPIAQAPALRAAARDRLPSILVADDSDMVRETIVRALRAEGYAVTEGRDGVEALEAAEHAAAAGTPFDVVTSDVMMPRMDGYELARRLRALPAYAAVPIVMLTSRGETIDRIRGFDAGVDEYLVKPVDRAELLAAVNRQLSARRTAPKTP
jgi:two-component system chemotaxis sensor kinase CheA